MATHEAPMSMSMTMRTFGPGKFDEDLPGCPSEVRQQVKEFLDAAGSSSPKVLLVKMALADCSKIHKELEEAQELLVRLLQSAEEPVQEPQKDLQRELVSRSRSMSLHEELQRNRGINMETIIKKQSFTTVVSTFINLYRNDCLAETLQELQLEEPPLVDFLQELLQAELCQKQLFCCLFVVCCIVVCLLCQRVFGNIL
ncbi:unnamed protein product [Polarella glacialis]|uniref:Uncharacterized protein n=1 Tax=Polarella glacialis TaxID=89957 RepID=A0A813FW82_POLGL|nr:unnamed protein product [Polarella glacialis]